jgi:ATP-dependent Lhr-like helicase
LTDQLRAIAALGKWPVDPFVLHQDSISKELRHHAECSLKENKPVTAICTGTLELGIDLGNVQSVCQVGPPWSVESLVQRVRSGQKEDQSQVLRLFTVERELNAHSPLSERLSPELIRGIALVELLIARWVESPGAFKRWNFSTLIHQVLSVLRQTGGLTLTNLYERLCAKGAFHGIDRQDFLLLLRNLKEKALINRSLPARSFWLREENRLLRIEAFTPRS